MNDLVKELQLEAGNLRKRLPLLQMIGLIFSLSIGCLSQFAGCVAGLSVGIYTGFLIEASLCEKLQKAGTNEHSTISQIAFS